MKAEVGLAELDTSMAMKVARARRRPERILIGGVENVHLLFFSGPAREYKEETCETM